MSDSWSMLSGDQLLVTGVRSGLGKACHEYFGGTGLDRSNREQILSHSQLFDTIIHCAFSRKKEVPEEDIEGYLEDTLYLTQRLLERCKHTFVLISSISVYPATHNFDSSIVLSQNQTPYSFTKLLCENACKNWAKRNARRLIILRLGSLLGPYSPANVTARILSGRVDTVPLNAEAKFNYVTYEEAMKFLEVAFMNSLEGTYDLGSSELITLREIAQIAKTNIGFGDIAYQAPLVPMKYSAKMVPSLSRTSEEKLRGYIDTHHTAAQKGVSVSAAVTSA